MDYTELRKEVEQEEWFTLANGCFDIYSPTDASIILMYKSEVCKINVFTTGKYMDTCQIYCSKPDYAYSHKRKRAKTLTNAVRAIGDAFYKITQDIDIHVEVEKARAERQRLMKIQQQNIIDEFKLPIIPTNAYSHEELAFRMSKHFALHFQYEGEPGKEKFAITGITGEFGLKQIEKFMEVLNVCPEAATDRILNGK